MSRYCYQGKMIDVWADDDGGLWFYDENGKVQTVEEKHGRTNDDQRVVKNTGSDRSIIELFMLRYMPEFRTGS